MKLVEVAARLGEKIYPLGAPLYETEFGGDEYEQLKVHSAPVAEFGIEALLAEIIAARTPDKKGITIAYAGFLGWDIGAAHDTEGLILLDKNPHQKLFNRAVVDLIVENSERKRFNDRFKVFEDVGRFDVRTKMAEHKHYKSFMHDDELYERVRKLAVDGMIASADMDVLDTERHERLRSLLRGYEIDIIYLSNIAHFYDPARSGFYSEKVHSGDREKIQANQKILGGPETLLIKADMNLGPGDLQGQYVLNVSRLGKGLSK